METASAFLDSGQFNNAAQNQRVAEQQLRDVENQIQQAGNTPVIWYDTFNHSEYPTYTAADEAIKIDTYAKKQNGKVEDLGVTGFHKFYDEHDGWQQVIQLQIGDTLRTDHGDVTVAEADLVGSA